jgi:hypothetical protein
MLFSANLRRKARLKEAATAYTDALRLRRRPPSKRPDTKHIRHSTRPTPPLIVRQLVSVLQSIQKGVPRRRYVRRMPRSPRLRQLLLEPFRPDAGDGRRRGGR